MRPWWRDAVVYQIYPRSFQDSDGDGEGDLRGIAQRLDHIKELGADAVWLSPIYPSPMADGGYDVADFTDVDRRFGTLEDLDALVQAAHDRGLRLLLDLVPCHTSIEHPWFLSDPDRYIWSPTNGPPNNWRAAFGGPAWSRDPVSGRWYLHSFYPEQPDLDWRNPAVPDAFDEIIRFWLGRGVDGLRLDALDRLLKDPALRDDPPSALEPVPPGHERDVREPWYSRNLPDVGSALARLRAAAGTELLVGEVMLPAGQLAPYLDHLDVAFCFDLFFAPWDAEAVRGAIARALDPDGPAGRVAWVTSNHDFARLPNRVGAAHARAATLMLLTLPGPVFVYQGDELGTTDGPGAKPPRDRAGRDPYRHPMAWDESAHGGFTSGAPWLPVVTPPEGPASVQRQQPDSMLALYRDLIAARRSLGEHMELLDAPEGAVAYRRGEHVVVLNLTDNEVASALRGRLVRGTHADRLPAGSPAPDRLAGGMGFLALAG